MDFVDVETKTGVRAPFQHLPASKNVALKFHIPTGLFYSPFVSQSTLYEAAPPRCSKCMAVIHPYAVKNKNIRKWACSFCGTQNPLTLDVGNHTSEEYIEGKVGNCGLVFIIDTCISQDEMIGLKSTLVKTIQKLPRNIHVGLITYNRVVSIYDFSENHHRFYSFNGHKQYQIPEIQDQLGIRNLNDPRHTSTAVLQRFYVPLEQNMDRLISCINDLDQDKFPYNDKTERQQRATGCALNLAIAMADISGISIRFALLQGGPCTIGPGQVVDLPLKETMRTFLDIHENNANVKYFKNAKKFYQTIESRLVRKHTVDIWAYGLDQSGLLEMRNIAEKTGGIIAMHELFNHFIFDSSFTLQYEANQQGLFKFPITAHMYMYISKQMKVSGIIGTCKSLAQDKQNQSAQTIIGQGKTSAWYLGGIQSNSALTIFLTNSDNNNDAGQKMCVIQFITAFKYSDNRVRWRINTVSKEYIRQLQIKEAIRYFDQEAAVVLLARYASYKASIEEALEVKTWLDRTLLKFTAKFANFHRTDVNSFRLPATMKLFPQFMYHLRRSHLINTFGCSPDESTFISGCLLRQCIANCVVMIQPALIMYKPDDPNPQAVALDLQNMREDVVLLLDSYFNVLIWYGQHVYKWKIDKVDEQEQYAYLSDLFNNPVEDSSQIMYDRIPVPNFYETFKGDGKQRYLKSRVNPSTSNVSHTDTGNFVTDDAPVKMFMDFLVKSVVNYTE